MIRIEKYEYYSASDYYDAVTSSPGNAAEGVYYLLKRRLSRALSRVFELHGFSLNDHFDDTIDDFFLYLYDRGDGQPFAIFGSIREKQAFFGWTVGTYRNFLLNKAKEEMKRKEQMEAVIIPVAEEERRFSDETIIRFIATAIAYSDQETTPRNRFIMYRMLLTILNPKVAVPQEIMAQAMGMHPVTYRVCVNRQKKRLSDAVSALETGKAFLLDSEHLLMRNRLVLNFYHLYEALIPYYEAALQALPMAVEINALRNGTGITLHERIEYSYPHVVDVIEFYNRLKS